MKAKEILKENGELFHKTRTETDLIRHIATREENSANYNLLLGAGASVTSGIKTAKTLVQEWTIELYERYNNKAPESYDDARQFFERAHGSWYNPTNPYSSLFEKKFDLPTQRRRFVEQEVDGKLPSIGYAYLVGLIKAGYFNTIFTTNFDDLINEAFYQFSSIRPIHCAHDSSIHSVSITSKRPKIIKLHGDYLFDDIKSTLSETESLEQNTKEKLVEFCKEYGLIVAGYSGNDRSIMDTIEFLVKQENYLKNGIYWCLREDDEVCHNLRNLFWKEKVYPVLIDGFDDFFAKCNKLLLKKPLDLRPNNKESKLQQAIQKIIDDETGLCKNPLIQLDIKEIREENNRQDISEFLNNLSTDKEERSELGIFDLRNLLEIETLNKKNRYEEAYSLCESYYNSASSEVARQRYISSLISLSEKRGKKALALRWCEKLLDQDPNNVNYQLLKTDLLTDIEEEERYLESLIEKHPYSHDILNSAAACKTNITKNHPSLSSDNAKIDEAITLLEKSLAIEPSLTNTAWMSLFDTIQYKSEISEDSYKEEKEKKIQEIITRARDQNPNHTRTLRMEIELAKSKKEAKTDLELVNKITAIEETSSKNEKTRTTDLLDLVFSSYFDLERPNDIQGKMKAFYNKISTEKDTPTKILLSKCEYLYGILGNKDSASEYFEEAIKRHDITHYARKAILLSEALGLCCTDIIEQKLEDKKNTLAISYYLETKAEILTYNNKIDEAIKVNEEFYREGGDYASYLINLSFCYLKNKNYKEATRLSKKDCSKISKIRQDALNVNIQYAAKQDNDDFYNKTKVLNLSAQSTDPGVKICSFIMLENHTKATQIAKEEVNKNKINKASYKRWPILQGTPTLAAISEIA